MSPWRMNVRKTSHDAFHVQRQHVVTGQHAHGSDRVQPRPDVSVFARQAAVQANPDTLDQALHHPKQAHTP